MTTIAAQYGFASPMDIYGDPANAGLRQARPDPNVLFPGDRVTIPGRPVKSLRVPSGQVHKFRARPARRRVKIVLADAQGQPLEGIAWEIAMGGVTSKGTTRADGVVEAEVSPSRTDATLRLNGGEPAPLKIGHLNPMRNSPDAGVSGVQARLSNLGYAPGAIDGVLGPRTRAAIRQFRLDHSLEPDGEIDDALLAGLEQTHGC